MKGQAGSSGAKATVAARHAETEDRFMRLRQGREPTSVFRARKKTMRASMFVVNVRAVPVYCVFLTALCNISSKGGVVEMEST
jgi:hypothetical protein